MSEGPMKAALLETGRRVAMHVSRLALAILCAASAVYCLVAHVPFSNQALIQRDVVSWLPLFVALQPWLFVLLSAGVVAATLPRYRLGRTKGWAMMTAISLGGFAIWLIVARPLANASMDAVTLTRAGWMFVPLALVGFFDTLDASRRVIWTTSHGAESARQFQSLAAATVVVTLVFFAAGSLHAPDGLLRGSAGLALGVTAFWSQLMLASCAFIVLAFARAVASFAYRSAFWEAVILLVLGALLLAKALVTIVLLPLAVEGSSAWTFALTTAFSLALLVYGTAIRHRAFFERQDIESGVDIIAEALGLVPGISRRVLAVVAVVVIGSVLGMAVGLAAFDWEFVLQRLLVVAAWAVFALVCYRLIPLREQAPDGTIAWLEICVLVLAGHYAVDRWGARIPSFGAGSGIVARWRSLDAGFRLANDTMSLNRRYPDQEFYAFLRERTNFSKGNRFEPVGIGQVDGLGELLSPKPNVFVFVVEGLRRDQVGVEGGNAALTPEIDLLAREGVSFHNAYTRYGAAGMAEHSIWLGGMMLHESYAEPFEPMNTLQRLLETGRYRQFVGDGPVLQSIVRDGPLVTRLPRGRERGADSCGQIGELQEALAPVVGGVEPVFAYLRQPGPGDGFTAAEPDDGSFDGSGARISPRGAKRLGASDKCLGGFFDFLRSKGLWDSSIVIVTSDRGASSAPQGTREGAHSLAPDVLRVPLVVKLAREQRGAYRADPDAIAFISDITPTLYYLLGQRPIRNSELLGRPLFTVELSEQLPYIRGDYLVAAGYGPVYGMLAENGARLFVADAINSRDTVYEIPRNGPASMRDPEPGESRRTHALMREKIRTIGDFYRAAR